jgi:hypothetical protein
MPRTYGRTRRCTPQSTILPNPSIAGDHTEPCGMHEPEAMFMRHDGYRTGTRSGLRCSASHAGFRWMQNQSVSGFCDLGGVSEAMRCSGGTHPR